MLGGGVKAGYFLVSRGKLLSPGLAVCFQEERDMTRWQTDGRAYALLLAGQSAAALALFWIVFPIFHRIVTHLGERQELALSQQLGILGSVVILYACYWTRLKYVPVVAPFRSTLVGHLCLFASRVSFFFGGALFSALFFRHLPELEPLPVLWGTFINAIQVGAVLFGLFCYSRELERLALSIEGPSRA